MLSSKPATAIKAIIEVGFPEPWNHIRMKFIVKGEKIFNSAFAPKIPKKLGQVDFSLS